MTETIPAEVIEKMAQAAEIYGNANIPEALKAAEALGWVMVPTEATDSMCHAFVRELNARGKTAAVMSLFGADVRAASGTMIAARPKVP